MDLFKRATANTIQHGGVSEKEWVSDGIMLMKSTAGIKSHYQGVKITKMARIGEKAIVVTDDMGTIRIFPYPYEVLSGGGYYKCYVDHLNNINNCVVSPDGRYLMTTSEEDKGIYIWRIAPKKASKNQILEY